MTTNRPTITVEPSSGVAHVRFRFDEGLRESVRALPGRRWDADRRCWEVPLGPELRVWAGTHDAEVTGSLEPTPIRPTVVRRGVDCAYIRFPRSESLHALMKREGARWLPDERLWRAPLTPDVSRLLDIPQVHLPALREAEPSSIGLYAHQQQVVQLVADGARRILLADEPGLGKTATSLRSAVEIGAERVVVVCPSVVRESWAREAQRWTPDLPPLVVTSGKKPLDLPECGVVVLSYEGAVAHQEALIAWHPQAVLLDEGHYVKNPTTARTIACTKVAHAVPATGLVMVLTGTPIPATVTDFVAPLHLLQRGGFLSVERRFTSKITRRGQTVVVGRDLDRLHAELSAVCMVRRTKAQVLDLPERVVADVPVCTGAAYARLEREAVRQLVIACKSRAKELGTPCTPEMVQEVVQRWARTDEGISATTELVHEVGREKVATAVERVTALHGAGEPVVVMAHHRDVQQELADALAERGVRVRRITGGQAPEARQAVIDDFQAGRLDAVVCSIRAAGVGITLTAASQMVLVELPWTDAAQQQAIDRLHRIGQSRSVTCWRLVMEASTDTVMRRRISERAAQAAAVVDGVQMEADCSTLAVEQLAPLVCARLGLSA